MDVVRTGEVIWSDRERKGRRGEVRGTREGEEQSGSERQREGGEVAVVRMS